MWLIEWKDGATFLDKLWNTTIHDNLVEERRAIKLRQVSKPSMENTNSAETKHVSFAAVAKRRVYITDQSYETTKSYSHSDQQIFREQSVNEGRHINCLATSCSLCHWPAIHFLLQRGLLSCEEFLGIEDLVSKRHREVLHQRQSCIWT